MTERCQKLGKWLQKARELASEEKKLKDKMPESRRRILDSKRIALMRYIIESEGYDDKFLADDVENGFSLVGDAPKSTVLPKKLVPATISQQDLGAHSMRANKALKYMTRSSGDAALDEQLWDKTLAEVSQGWKGPWIGMSSQQVLLCHAVFLCLRGLKFGPLMTCLKVR